MSTSADYIRSLESIKFFRNYQALNNLFDMWCRARYNCCELDVITFKKYNWIINNTSKETI